MRELALKQALNPPQRVLTSTVKRELTTPNSETGGKRRGLCASLSLIYGRKGRLCAELSLFSLRYTLGVA